MSDETAVNLEDDGPDLTAPEPVSEPAQSEPTSPSSDSTPNPEAVSSPDVEVDGQKMVPLAALSAVRAKEAELRQQLHAQQAQFQAQQAQMGELLHRLTPPPPQVPPQADPMAVEMAQRLALFKPDGSLDVEGGSRMLGMVDQIAERRAQQYIAPLQKVSAQQQSVENYHRVLAAAKDASGKPPNPQALQAVWQSLPVEYTADPQTANALGIFAFGLERLQNGQPPPPAPPVTMTEPSGGLPQNRPQLSALDRTIAGERGRTDKQWAEHVKNFNPKRSNALED